MTCAEVMLQLKKLGTEQTRKTWIRHGAPADDVFGVKIGDMKTIQKKIKVDHPLALELYATGNSDAMYFAALIADDAKFTKKQLQTWADEANWFMLSEYSVAWCASGSPHGWDLATKWIESKNPKIRVSGWSTLSSIASVKPDGELDIAAYDKLLQRVQKTIHQEPNDRVRYVMNGFVIALGCFVRPLHAKAVAAAKAIGKVTVDMGDTACKVPLATEYIQKVASMRRVGQKRKMAKC